MLNETNFAGPGHRLGDSPGESKRIFNIQESITQLTNCIIDASNNLPAGGSTTDDNVDEQLTNLTRALVQSADILTAIGVEPQLIEGDELPRDQGLIQINDRSLPAISSLVDVLKDASDLANVSLEQGNQQVETLVEYKNKYLKPVNAVFKSIEKNTAYEVTILRRNAKRTNDLAEITQRDLRALSSQIPRKQEEISTHEKDLSNRREEAKGLQERTDLARVERDCEIAEAKEQERVGRYLISWPSNPFVDWR